MNNRLLVVAALAVLLLGSCADSKEVNSAFAQTRVSWFVFDTDQATGLRSFAGFEQTQKVVWQPRNKAVFATDLAPAPGKPGAAAVSGLGLLLLDDADGFLTAERPGSKLPLGSYRTGRLFTWNQKLFMTLAQEAPAVLTPATLAWWAPGQVRLAFYPVPSQVQFPGRQAVGVQVPPPGTSLITFTWKEKQGEGWRFEDTGFDLANGAEGPPAAPPVDSPLGTAFDTVKARLAERLGVGVASQAVQGADTVLLFTESGWVAVAKTGDSRARLYRLPDLGVAGRYTKALALTKGYVFSWETNFRGYAGSAGLVHVPFAVLAP